MGQTKAQQQQADGKTAAIYVRVSGEAQALEESVSLAEQTRDIEAYAEERGYTIIQRYQDVESGVSRIRPGFQRLQAEAKAFAVRHHHRVEVRPVGTLRLRDGRPSGRRRAAGLRRDRAGDLQPTDCRVNGLYR